MSLQGPLLVVAETPAEELVEALGAAGAFPVVETSWADAPTAFASVKPAAVVLAAPDASPSESAARMLCLQIATANGAIVPVIAATEPGHEPVLPIALAADAAAPFDRLIARLQAALRVREMHAAVLRRADAATAETLAAADPLDDATVLIAGRGALRATLAAALGERVRVVGALSVESAARHLNSRDVDGVIVGEGLSPLMTDAFLAALAEDARFRGLPVSVIGRIAQPIPETLPNVDHVEPDARRIAARMLPMVRLNAFAARLSRALAALESGGAIDPDTGLMTESAFAHELGLAIAAAAERSQPLSLARFSFDGLSDTRGALDAARLVTRLVRSIDFAGRDETGAILMAFTQTDLRSAHVVARRLAGALKTGMVPPQAIAANVTLATWKAGDTVDTLMLRVAGAQMVAAE